ncbi:hypothetical protein BEP19_06595 [Ammoniphilus oxalaticus]|uniref:Pyridoxamine 5'-phosphate oxidase N-terminal domain-containing protein n=1 Tax=Ammoniphilus oxalaticus TaxID=66863 RepID=A0A419SJ84_9BACL|nr:pyridoxamine 5'-phosphate oxidase family protein [Ammoniphilus oxalaticus]RKD24073.1 hypothetical protein BEP19_06595 [Ammoniphilus oxalaticus]
MADKVAKSLPEQLLRLLKEERFVLLSTIDKDTGAPYTHAISWLYAPNQSKILFAVDSRSKLVDNIKANELVSLTLIGSGSVYSINGHASIAAEQIEGAPIKLAKVVVSVDDVHDTMFYGSKISVEPQYEKTYDKQAADKLDHQVMSALKGEDQNEQA